MQSQKGKSNSSQQCLSGCYGFPLDSSDRKSIELPISKISYDIEIINGAAKVSLSQTYVNTGNTFLEIQYKLPISPKSCIYKFIATFGKHMLEGVVKEKEEAKIEFKEAVEAGRRAALADVDSKSRDIMTFQIGNLGPGQAVKLQICYTEELSVCLNTFYQFNLTTKCSPRYINSIPLEDYLSAFRKSAKTVEGTFEWDFKLRLRTSRKVISYRSLTHALVLEKGNDQSTDLQLTVASGQAFTSSFSFIYTTEQFELPSYTLGRTDAGSSVMVSFIPKYCPLDIKDAELAALNRTDFETDMDAVKGEYVFLLDRSGSMSGSRIAKAKEALTLFLKSLPIDTYFQVVSFGSGSQRLFSQSQRNGNESITQAIKKIEAMDADLGGTEIYKPLKNILESSVIEGYPKQIFLLTDGEISDTENVISLVQSNIRHSRVHTIGIGNEVSEALIIGCAEKGKGSHIFIKEGEDPSEKIIQLLNDSLTPVISKVWLAYDKDLVECIVPNPEKIPYILKGQVVNFYVMFKGHLEHPTAISLTYIDSVSNLPYKSTVEVTPDISAEEFVDKLANFRRINALEESQQAKGKEQDYLYYVKAVDKKRQIIDLSIKFQIISKYTAFICVEKELIDGKYQQIQSIGSQKIQIVESQNQLKKKIKQVQEPYHVEIMSSQFEAAQYEQYDEDEEDAMYKNYCFEEEFCCQEEICNKVLCESSEESEKKEEDEMNENFCCQEESEPSEDNEENEEDEMNEDLEVQCCYKKEKQQIFIKAPQTKAENVKYSIKEIVKEQLFEGSWNNQLIIQSLFAGDVLSCIQGMVDSQIAITYLIVIWIEKYHPEKEYSMIVKKARNWLRKQKGFADLPSLLDAFLK